ncbi:MAG TPA: class I SAM-dependent methyltransferase [Actinomycetes bacterium]|nr:class I SAM-dependent methyltransferase [Actinomycetes bacterium]
MDWSAAPSGGGVGEPDESGGDPYAGEVHCWWHLSGLSPELVAAVGDGWLPDGGLAVDLGCGLGTEVGYLADLGFQAVGVDLSMVALGRARRLHPRARFVAGDLLRLPVGDGLVDVVLDRGCFHYLAPADRGRYASAAWRALRPGGRLLLRACLRAHGIRNDLSAAVLRATFAGWREVSLREQPIPSDSRQMPALVARYERP